MSFFLNGQSIKESVFLNPPKEYRTKTWFHAMSSNMSKVGLTKDLEAMKEAGLGGALLFNVTQFIPKGKVEYASDLHKDMILHAGKEAKRIGLDFGIHNCDGWSSTGGPWISNDYAMKMVVWSDTIIKANGKVKLHLEPRSVRDQYYKDIMVIAHPAFPEFEDDLNNKPNVTCNDVQFNTNILIDGNTVNEARVTDKNPVFDFKYSNPKTLRSALAIFNDRNLEISLFSVDENGNERFIQKLKKVRTGKGEWIVEDHFAPITSKWFRLKLNQASTLKEIVLSSVDGISDFMGKTSRAKTSEDPLEFSDIKIDGLASNIIDPAKILKFKSNFNVNNIMDIDLPEGKWVVTRYGYSITGAVNNPASVEGRGNEIDKFSSAAVDLHFDKFIDKVINHDTLGGFNPIQYLEIDSYEMGGQNWTQGLDSIFLKRQGYNLLDFMPLFKGHIVGSREMSDAVLWDFRRFTSELMVENYYGRFAELTKKRGMKLYIEPYGFGPFNSLDAGGKADIPMGEFWMDRDFTQVHAAISAGRIYGKNVISAESFTAEQQINWKGHPSMVKKTGDFAWTHGINEFMLHRFVHQANPTALPGMTMSRWGFHFDRTQTWWLSAGKAWLDYTARGSYLLRQGLPISHVAVFVGDGAPNNYINDKYFPKEVAKFLKYDNINADVLIKQSTALSGRLILPSGLHYKGLVLANSSPISLITAQKIQQFIKSGLPIYGEPLSKIGGYLALKNSSTEYSQLIVEINKSILPIEQLKELDETTTFKTEPKGKLDIAFIHRKNSNEEVFFLVNRDTFSVSGLCTFDVDGKEPQIWDAMIGKVKKLHDYKFVNGKCIVPLSFTSQQAIFLVFRGRNQNQFTVVENSNKLDIIKEKESMFALTNKKEKSKIKLSNGKEIKINGVKIPNNVNISDKWSIRFTDPFGEDSTIISTATFDWSKHSSERIKYFSGTATYTKEFDFPYNLDKENLVVNLDLKKVYVVAQVKLNDKEVTTLWHPPYNVDISNFLVKGSNKIEIKVTNLWANRLIGDERFPPNDDGYKYDSSMIPNSAMPAWYTSLVNRPAGLRKTFTTASFFKSNDPLEPSGLLGNIELLFMKKIPLNK
jgi:hypothetical protein